jgi:hypothetical protein
MATVAAKGDELISIAEAAGIMRCSKSWVLVLLRNGELVGSKIHSRAWLVSRRSAEQNAEDYQQAAGKRRVGRPRADNAPPTVPASRLTPGRPVGSSGGNNPRSPGSMVALSSNDSMIIRADDLMAVGTAAAVSGFHRSAIHQMIKAGKLWALCIDGQFFVRKVDAKRIKGTRTKRGRPRKAAAE